MILSQRWNKKQPEMSATSYSCVGPNLKVLHTSDGLENLKNGTKVIKH
jgi:hypothetical protein